MIAHEPVHKHEHIQIQHTWTYIHTPTERTDTTTQIPYDLKVDGNEERNGNLAKKD